MVATAIAQAESELLASMCVMDVRHVPTSGELGSASIVVVVHEQLPLT